VKELACAVYNLVTGSEARCAALSQPERTALADVEPLLRLSPRELASLLAKSQATPDWLKTPSG
jgi:hypothetical protein